MGDELRDALDPRTDWVPGTADDPGDGFAHVFRAAGVTHAPGYPANLADLTPVIERDGSVPVELVPDPSNPVHTNAISVRYAGRHLGWVPADLADRVIGLVERHGPDLNATAVVAVHPDHEDRPGLAVRF